MRRGDQVEQRIQEFTPAIRAMAHRLAFRLPAYLDAEDLISVGTIGLMDAMDKCDPSRKANFKAYAWFRIRGAMIDEIREMSFVPRSIYESAITVGHHHMCNVEDTALTDTHMPDPLSYAISQCERNSIIQAISRLSERARAVITLYYYRDLTMKEIGRRLSLTEGRVSQIHSQAILKLREQVAERAA